MRDYLQHVSKADRDLLGSLLESCDLDTEAGRRKFLRSCAQAMLKGKLPDKVFKEVRAYIELELTMDAHHKDNKPDRLPAGQSFRQLLANDKQEAKKRTRRLFQTPPDFASAAETVPSLEPANPDEETP